MTRHAARVRLELDTPSDAERLAASVAPENGSHVGIRVEGSTLVAEAEGDTPLGLLRTLDDLLACLAAAQRAATAASPAYTGTTETSSFDP